MALPLNDVIRSSHHEQLPLCETRPSYRQGRKLTAVKVYTISDESTHLLVVGVPSIGLYDQVKRLCQRYGDVLSVVFVPNYADEKFTDVFHVQYSKLQSSRFAKRQLDGKEFYGGILHVCYVPEMESVVETRKKLVQRRREVAVRCSRVTGSEEKNDISIRQYQRRPLKALAGSKKILNAGLLQCIWNGQPQSEDPRQNFTLTNTNKICGPQLPSPEWKAAGVRERYIQPKRLKSSTVAVCKKQADGVSGSPSQNSSGASIASETVLRFIPRQVKGVQRKTIGKKVEELPNTSTQDKSLDSTVQAVRDRIRNVSVHNIKIHLSGRQESKFSEDNAL